MLLLVSIGVGLCFFGAVVGSRRACSSRCRRRAGACRHGSRRCRVDGCRCVGGSDRDRWRRCHRRSIAVGCGWLECSPVGRCGDRRLFDKCGRPCVENVATATIVRFSGLAAVIGVARVGGVRKDRQPAAGHPLWRPNVPYGCIRMQVARPPRCMLRGVETDYGRRSLSTSRLRARVPTMTSATPSPSTS